MNRERCILASSPGPRAPQHPLHSPFAALQIRLHIAIAAVSALHDPATTAADAQREVQAKAPTYVSGEGMADVQRALDCCVMTDRKLQSRTLGE